ncbi:hypothetical protein ElyMa_001127200 [Elysia marginata]|uniref:Uncharacterized protein n=1 Tax=Elysia marginata TaxID=1093978 RepID=A0AAV4HXC2_9GAST|nr:hypothetical protein ElyMa_001127200 [Elysia marginata]
MTRNVLLVSLLLGVLTAAAFGEYPKCIEVYRFSIFDKCSGKAYTVTDRSTGSVYCCEENDRDPYLNTLADSHVKCECITKSEFCTAHPRSCFGDIPIAHYVTWLTHHPRQSGY